MRKNNRNYSFSFIETIVSLSIISLISLVLYFACSASYKSLFKSKNSIKTSSEILTIDKTIRNQIGTVLIPFWAKDYVFSFDTNSISLSYLDGVSELQQINIPYAITIQNVTILKYKSGLPAGLAINYSYKNHDYLINSLFSSIPYGEKLIDKED